MKHTPPDYSEVDVNVFVKVLFRHYISSSSHMKHFVVLSVKVRPISPWRLCLPDALSVRRSAHWYA